MDTQKHKRTDNELQKQPKKKKCPNTSHSTTQSASLLSW